MTSPTKIINESGHTFTAYINNAHRFMSVVCTSQPQLNPFLPDEIIDLDEVDLRKVLRAAIMQYHANMNI